MEKQCVTYSKCTCVCVCVCVCCVYSLSNPAWNVHASYCLQYFSTYYINGMILEKRLLNTKYMFWFTLQILSEIFFNLRITERDMIKMSSGLHVKYPLFSPIWMKPEISGQFFSKNTQISNFRKIRPLGVDGRTDRYDEANGRFHNFSKALKNKNKKNISFTILRQYQICYYNISQIYFDNVLYTFRTDLLSIITSLNTVYTTICMCHVNSVEC